MKQKIPDVGLIDLRVAIKAIETPSTPLPISHNKSMTGDPAAYGALMFYSCSIYPIFDSIGFDKAKEAANFCAKERIKSDDNTKRLEINLGNAIAGNLPFDETDFECDEFDDCFY